MHKQPFSFYSYSQPSSLVCVRINGYTPSSPSRYRKFITSAFSRRADLVFSLAKWAGSFSPHRAPGLTEGDRKYTFSAARNVEALSAVCVFFLVGSASVQHFEPRLCDACAIRSLRAPLHVCTHAVRAWFTSSYVPD